MTRNPLKTGALMAVALALILGAHEVNRLPGWSLLGVYFYWFVRIGMAYLIIIGAHAALGQVMSKRSSPVAHAGLATALSYPPFVMAVTTLDLLIGDLTLLQTDPNTLVTKLGLDAASLIDNHLTTAALLLAPYVAAARRTDPGYVAPPIYAEPAPGAPVAAKDGESNTDPEPEEAPSRPPETPGLLLASQPQVRGELLAAEAQEHYVKLKATEQSGMALYRFGDAVRDLNRYRGMQIHRSHWVADNAVTAVIGKRGAMKLELSNGEIVPVSRRYELEVEARYASRERRAE